MGIERDWGVDYAVDCTATLATCDAVDNRTHAAMSILVAAGSEIDSAAIYGCSTQGGTYVPLYDEDGVAVTMTLDAGRIQAVPPSVMSVPWIKFVTDSTGTIDVMKKG